MIARQVAVFSVFIVAVALTAACVTPYHEGPRVPPRSYAQDVRSAEILEIREIVVEGSDGVQGAQTGAYLGGLLAAFSQDRGNVNPLIVIAGALFGGAVGASLEKAQTNVPAVEYLLELSETGDVIRIVQEGTDPVAPVGATVSLIYADRVYVDYP